MLKNKYCPIGPGHFEGDWCGSTLGSICPEYLSPGDNPATKCTRLGLNHSFNLSSNIQCAAVITVRGPTKLPVQKRVLVIVAILTRPIEDHGHWSGQTGTRSRVFGLPEQASLRRSSVCANAASWSKLVVPPPTKARRKNVRFNGRISTTDHSSACRGDTLQSQNLQLRHQSFWHRSLTLTFPSVWSGAQFQRSRKRTISRGSYHTS
jgi:hypothetical protein